MSISHSRLQSTRWRLLAMVLTVVVIPVSATAQTTSDLFEKAVYADETAGDLDEAIKLYGKVIAEAKATSDLAAEAQYRLGLCFEKQGDEQKAREAFQAVVDDYPKVDEFVSLAKEHLPGAMKLLPIPWEDGQQLHMVMKLPTGIEIGKFVYSIDEVERDGQPAWRSSNRNLVTVNNASSFSEVFCDHQSFAPLSSHWQHSMLGLADATYTEGQATIDISGRDDPLEIEFTIPGYDNEQGAQVFRRLPLKVGLKASLTIISTLGGSLVPLEFEVPKKEKITTAAGEFDCFRMDLKIGQTFWISDDANRYLVRFEVGGVVVDLIRVEQRKQDESYKVEDKQFAITLPGSWYSFEPKSEEDSRVVHLLDPRAIGLATLTIAPKSSLEKDEQASPLAWIESGLKNKKKSLKGYKLRGEGASTINSENGQNAASAVYDYVQNKKAMTAYNVSVIGDQSAASLRFVVPKDQFESQRGEFEQLVRSLQVK